jgi:adenylyltransferase/sulfurtransferase
MNSIVEISPLELEERLAGDNPPVLLDVREAWERERFHIGGIWIPMGEIASRIEELPLEKELVVYCAGGVRSAEVIRYLQQERKDAKLFNLRGGLAEFSMKGKSI